MEGFPGFWTGCPRDKEMFLRITTAEVDRLSPPFIKLVDQAKCRFSIFGQVLISSPGESFDLHDMCPKYVKSKP
jgi:hypothetical protein